MDEQMCRIYNNDATISVLLLFLLAHYVTLASKQAAVNTFPFWKVTENRGDENATKCEERS